MRVLHLGSKEYPVGTNKGFDPQPSGGIEFYVEGLVKNLDVENIVITRKFPGTKPHEKGVYRVPYINGFFLRNPSYNFSAFFKALTLQFDVIVAHDVIASWCALKLGIIKRRPVVMVCHGVPSEQPQYNIVLRTLFKILENVYKLSTRTVCASENQAKKIGVRATIIPPGLRKLKKDSSLKGKYKGKKIVFVNRLIRVKGVEYLLQALRKLKMQYTCIIVGDGPQRKEYEELAKGTNTIFTGHRDDVEKFLGVADVFVLPSVSEGLSYSMLEAMSAGIPCVVADIGICPKSAAVVVPVKDSNSIAEGIGKALGNKTVAANGKKFAEKFSWNSAGKAFKAMMEEIV